MAIFARRTLQRLIFHNRDAVVGASDVNHASELNAQTLSAEWEVVILAALSKLGSVSHHRKFGGATPDIYFEGPDGRSIFVAEIRTVSDKNLEEQNPLEYIEESLWDLKYKYSLPGRFSVALGPHLDIARQGRKRKLPIPERQHVHREVLDSKEFVSFIKQIRRFPTEVHDVVFRRPYICGDGHLCRLDFKISYSQLGRSGSSHISYTVLESLEQNVIWRALQDKYKHLKSTGFDGPRGIFLCDGDCAELRNLMPTWYGKSLRQIVSAFLRSKPRLDFVCAVTIKEDHGRHSKKKVWLRNFFNSKCPEAIKRTLDALDSAFPEPERTAYNAKNFWDGASFFGGGTMSEREVTVSARTVCELLAGRLELHQFPEFYKTGIAQALDEGSTLSDIKLQKMPDEDDDWLTLKFDGPDPAVSPFRNAPGSDNQP